MNSNVIPLKPDTVNQVTAPTTSPAEYHDTVTAFVGAAVHQTDAENREYERRFHKRATSLVEQINALTRPMVAKAEECAARWAEWTDTHRQATHLPFLGKVLLIVVLTITVFGEWILAATALQGLRLDDLETYLMALGVVGVGFACTKGIATICRWLVAEHWTTPLKRTVDLIGIALGTFFLGMLIYGMTEARVAYADLDKVTGGQGISGATSHGLNLLQGALYALQVFIFWALASPDPKGQRARVNYEQARKALDKLHAKRVKLASKLNYEVNDLHAKCEANISLAGQLVSHYYRELAIFGKALPGDVSTEFRRDWFLPVSDRVSTPVDAIPETVQQVLAGQPASERWTWPAAKNRDGTTSVATQVEQSAPAASGQTPALNTESTDQAAAATAVAAAPKTKTFLHRFEKEGNQ